MTMNARRQNYIFNKEKGVGGPPCLSFGLEGATGEGDRACVARATRTLLKGRDLCKSDVKKHVILAPHSTNLVRLNSKD